jgi:hypothetical protein
MKEIADFNSLAEPSESINQGQLQEQLDQNSGVGSGQKNIFVASLGKSGVGYFGRDFFPHLSAQINLRAENENKEVFLLREGLATIVDPQTGQVDSICFLPSEAEILEQCREAGRKSDKHGSLYYLCPKEKILSIADLDPVNYEQAAILDLLGEFHYVPKDERDRYRAEKRS